VKLLPLVLDAAERFAGAPPPPDVVQTLVARLDPLFV